MITTSLWFVITSMIFGFLALATLVVDLATDFKLAEWIEKNVPGQIGLFVHVFLFYMLPTINLVTMIILCISVTTAPPALVSATTALASFCLVTWICHRYENHRLDKLNSQKMEGSND